MNPAFETILCAVDFSEFSKGVIRAGEAMAQRFGSTLLIFHTVCFPRERLGGILDGPGTKGEQEAIRSAHEKIADLMKESPALWRSLVTAGDPVVNVARAARTERADLVMAASHGMSGFKRLFLGTVAERFSGLIEQPLMILRRQEGLQGDDAEKGFHVGRIAVCCTLDPKPQALVDAGAALASGWNAQLILVHVLEAPPGDDGNHNSDLGSYEEVQRKQQERARSGLMDLVPRHLRGEIDVKARVLLGVPGEKVRDLIRESGTDLVIVGGARRGPVGFFMVGSTTRFLIRHSPCSVLSLASG